ncbi:hypothetical protein ASG12_02315 [Williamsia sp. Leaf354]|uniref:DUF7800 domain-containing protein n=1 Tax=Williamsia sp. Leaf354 TaxID=1736349 RepID=UPI0006F54808|nr:alkaline phosphatase D family protein [Williamsia sp. Leaf354]KQR99652.1 hypothetical protein ASG12_02315 [Williamsia sp. Leaf354]
MTLAHTDPSRHDRADRGAPALVLGPLLRFVDESRATIWVETDRATEVRIDTSVGVSARTDTWGVGGHHYAIVVLEGLPADTQVDYSVVLGDDTGSDAVWPPDGEQCRLRTAAVGADVTIAFGSCRRGDTYDEESLGRIGADALVGLAHRVNTEAPQRRPDLLMLLGDQVYADDPSPEILARLHRHRAQTGGQGGPVPGRGALDDEVADEICDLEEYTWLYAESWGTPEVRALMAAVPSCMILDDHDLRDDWNSSMDWRRTVTAAPWWPRRVVGAFTSYWIYQHLGNLSPESLAIDPVYAAVRGAATDADREQILADFALRADAEPDSARWSFVRDLGATRLIVIDSRCSRDLDPERRTMLDDNEWQWLRTVATETDARHIVFGTSLPYLMLPALHHLEQWNEAVAQGAWGPRAAKLGEKLRLELDLEHWAAFDNSFDAMADLVGELTSRATPPASVVWLSGDVHCSYVAEAELVGRATPDTTLCQLTMSPFRNPLERPVRAVNRIAVKAPMVKLMRALAKRAGAGPSPMSWKATAGPWFDNGVMSLTVSGERISVRVEHAFVDDDGAQRLSQTHVADLTAGPATSAAQ